LGSVSTGEHTLRRSSQASTTPDIWHDECSRLRETLRGPLIVPTTVVAAVCYMISRYRFGSAAEAAFLRSFATGDLVIGNLVEEDFERMAQLVEQYDSFPLGGSDASVIAMAERRSVTTILTTGRRHFAAGRPKHVEAFECEPEPGPHAQRQVMGPFVDRDVATGPASTVHTASASTVTNRCRIPRRARGSGTVANAATRSGGRLHTRLLPEGSGSDTRSDAAPNAGGEHVDRRGWASGHDTLQ